MKQETLIQIIRSGHIHLSDFYLHYRFIARTFPLDRYSWQSSEGFDKQVGRFKLH